MTKELLRASFSRAERTFFQSLASTSPVGLVVTPVMIQNANWNLLVVVFAWLGTAIIASGCGDAWNAQAGNVAVRLAKLIIQLPNITQARVQRVNTSIQLQRTHPQLVQKVLELPSTFDQDV